MPRFHSRETFKKNGLHHGCIGMIPECGLDSINTIPRFFRDSGADSDINEVIASLAVHIYLLRCLL